MSDLDAQFETPLPGLVVPDGIASGLLDAFIEKFRGIIPPEVPANLPTACVLKGRKDPDYLRRAPFVSRTIVLVWFETAKRLHQATPDEILKYLADKQPWEDYDICLFDETLHWCVGLTHNNDVIVVERADI